MEGTIQIHIEKLPEGLYLATSDDIQGLVAQGRTITETLEIARDIVKKLIEAQSENGGNVRKLGDNLDRKSTRLNSSHGYISYAVFCLKKKTSHDLRLSSHATLLLHSPKREGGPDFPVLIWGLHP